MSDTAGAVGRSRIARLSRFLPPAIAAASFVLYWVTLQPGLSGGDSAEAQYVPYTLSIMHYTGYPLYTVLGYAWSRLVTIGDVAYRMNLLSAVAGAIAVGLLVWLGRVVSRYWLAGVVAGVLMGSSTLFWDWSTKAGVRSLNVAFIVAILALTMVWARGQQQTATATNWRWIALWFAVGLSLAHHRTTILFLPAVIVYLLWSRPRLLRDWRALLMAALAIMPGLLFYLYLPLRSANAPAFQPLPVDSIDHFLDLVLARNLSDMVTAITWQQVPERLGRFVQYLVTQMGIAGILGAVIGLVLLAVRRPKEGVMLWLAVILLTAFTIDYRIQGMTGLNDVFLLPVNAIAGLGVGYCLASAMDLLSQLSFLWRSKARSMVTVWIGNGAGWITGLAVITPIVANSLAWVRPASEPHLDAYRVELRGQQALRLTTYPETYIQPHGVIVGEWEHAAAFWYQQLVNRRWTDMQIRYPVDDTLGIYIDQAWSQGREIYVTRAVPGLGEGRYLSMAGPLIHILHEPASNLPAQAMAVRRGFEDGLSLEGYHVFTDMLRPGGVLPVSLYWRAKQRLQIDDSISVRLVDPQGQQVAQEDAEQPVLGSYPTSHWPAGAIVGDYYELRLPTSLMAGEYTLALVVYQRNPDGTAHNLRNQHDGQMLTSFATVHVMQALS